MTTNTRIPVPSTDIELEGRLGSMRLGAVVAPPHPLYGGHLSNPVVVALVEGLAQRGIGALAFNWRGVGTSGGRVSADSSIALIDYTAALAYVKALAPSSLRWIASGYSFGAATALAVAAVDPSIREVVAVAPPVVMLPRAMSFAAADCRITVIAANEDEFAPIDNLRAAFANVAGARIIAVKGADHFFSGGGLDEIADAAAGGR